LQEENEIYLESIIALREKNYQEAEDKLNELLKKEVKNRKAEIILGCLQIRRECQKLITAMEN